MSLTYPVPNQFDASRPENQWFFYWKTSPSLWESKISQLSSETPLLVPVYWGLHANEDGAFDFGGIRPETDLYQFCQLTKNIVYHI